MTLSIYIFKSRRGKNKNLTALKSNSNTVWFNLHTYIELDYIRLKIKPNSVRIRFYIRLKIKPNSVRIRF